MLFYKSDNSQKDQVIKRKNHKLKFVCNCVLFVFGLLDFRNVLYLPSTKVQEIKSIYVSKTIVWFVSQGNWRKRNLKFYFLQQQQLLCQIIILSNVFGRNKILYRLRFLLRFTFVSVKYTLLDDNIISGIIYICILNWVCKSFINDSKNFCLSVPQNLHGIVDNCYCIGRVLLELFLFCPYLYMYIYIQ